MLVILFKLLLHPLIFLRLHCNRPVRRRRVECGILNQHLTHETFSIQVSTFLLILLPKHPTKKREDSRMMVIHRKTGQIENKHFRDILDYFDDKDVFVVNNTKVFPARMYGRKEKTGAKIEVFLIKRIE